MWFSDGETDFQKAQRLGAGVGTLHIPMAILLSAGLLLGTGVASLMREREKAIRLQLRVDECVAHAALELKKRLNTIEETNKKVRALRLALLVTGLNPAVKATLMRTLKDLSLNLSLQLSLWTLTRGKWLLNSSCSRTSFIFPLPAIPFSQQPADPLGPRPLLYRGSFTPALKIKLSNGVRRSGAVVERKGVGDFIHEKNETWTAAWWAPSEISFLGANSI